jgi:hypothetical protein
MLLIFFAEANGQYVSVKELLAGIAQWYGEDSFQIMGAKKLAKQLNFEI